MKLIISFALATTLALPTHAQDLGSALLSGVGNSAIRKGDTILKEAPNDFKDFMDSTDAGKDFVSEAACLGTLQAAINTGLILANILPFSSVETVEDDRGPAARFRIMMNGEKHHFDAYCEQSTLTSAKMPWGNGSDLPTRAPQSTFDAGAGLLLLLHAQGAFEKEPFVAAKESTDGRITAQAPTEAVGPPLSSGEQESLRVATSACWNIGALSTEAAQTTVRIQVDFNEDTTPVASSIRLASSSGGSDAAARQAFEAAKRAVIRCGSRGFDLPVDKYDHWKTLVLTFDPMRSR